ncbi:MAG: hypothetical protein HQL40_09150 [Alphaproteobacteria bacterium]|nr:hypothetical protein [Alphaproteobacteria bacterium]
MSSKEDTGLVFPDGIFDWLEHLLKWTKRNIVAGGIAILISLGLDALASVPQIATNESVYYANYLSFLVLTISALMVNADFEKSAWSRYHRVAYWLNTVALGLVVIGICIVVILSPNAFIKLNVANKSLVELTTIIVSLISVAVAYLGNVIQTISNKEEYRSEIRKREEKDYSQKVDDHLNAIRGRALSGGKNHGLEL